MSLGLLVWTVACIGTGLAAGASEKSSTGRVLMSSAGLACMLWAFGVGLWMLAGWLA